MTPQIQAFFDPATATVTYVVYEADGRDCAIIDSVLDYDPKAGRTSTASADKVIAFVREHGLQCRWLLETHAHADHLSAAPYLQQQLGGDVAIGAAIQTVQQAFAAVYHQDGARADGSQFDQLFAPDQVFHIGQLEVRALHVPGHTPADLAYQIGDACVVGEPCSCRTWVRHAAISPAAPLPCCTAPRSACCRCRRRRGCSCATTTRPMAAKRAGK